MPYLSPKRIEELKGAWKDLTPGDLNYLFTELLIKKWRENPRYATIHALRTASVHPEVDNDFWDLRATFIEHGLSVVDIRIASDLAFMEFYRRVASEYEDKKAVDNGDVYSEAIDDLMSGGC